MAKILLVGIATLDIINEVESYPHEDDEIRALKQEKRRGGNATNTAVVLSQLGHQCYWAGSLTQESDSQIILNDLNRFKINTDYCDILTVGKIPTSYVTLNKSNGSRTIIHYRELSEYPLSSFKKINLSDFDWLHFEGRNINQTLQMMQFSKTIRPELPLSLEVEKPREHLETLMPLADHLLFSKHYALQKGFTSAEKLLDVIHQRLPQQKTLICAWGDEGAMACKNNRFYRQSAVSPANIVDTLGAGDVFNAAVIHQLLNNNNLAKTLSFACQLAGKKCSRKGLSHLSSV